MPRKLMKDEYIGQTVTVATGSLQLFVGEVLGFGQTVPDSAEEPTRVLVHIQDEHGDTAWFDIKDISYGQEPMKIRLAESDILDKVEEYIDQQIVTCQRKRRLPTTSNQIRSALGGRNVTLTEIKNMIRDMRTIK